MGICVILWYDFRLGEMSTFYGEYNLTMDAKGRILLPAPFRKQLAEGDDKEFVLKRGSEKCLTMYTMNEWTKITARLEALNPFNPKIQQFKRLFLNGILTIEMDTTGRLLIPKNLQEYAQLSKDIVFWGQGDKIEIWDIQLKEAYIQQYAQNENDLAAELF